MKVPHNTSPPPLSGQVMLFQHSMFIAIQGVLSPSLTYLKLAEELIRDRSAHPARLSLPNLSTAVSLFS